MASGGHDGGSSAFEDGSGKALRLASVDPVVDASVGQSHGWPCEIEQGCQHPNQRRQKGGKP